MYSEMFSFVESSSICLHPDLSSLCLSSLLLLFSLVISYISNVTSHSCHFISTQPAVFSFSNKIRPWKQVSSLRSFWTLMYKTLIDSKYEIHHTWHWSVSSWSFYVALVNTSLKESMMMQGSEWEEEKLLRFCLLDWSLPLMSESEMRSTTASNWH